MRRFVPLLAVLVAATSAHAQSGSPLRVVRSTPSDDAAPTATIAVTFDRPVAGSLDRTVDPARLLRVEPAVAGKVEWRDAVTLRLVPAGPLVAGQRYTVTISNDFHAMDGSALPAPHQFTFRAKGATLLSGFPVGPDRPAPTHMALNQKFELTYSAPVDLARLGAATQLEFRSSCYAPRFIPLTAASQRRPTARRGADADEGEMPRDRASDTLRRVVQLVPASALPRGCDGELVAPTDLADPAHPTQRMSFSTYGDFRAASLDCGDGEHCPTGPVVLHFSNPVRGAEVQRRVRLLPETRFVVRDTAGESTSWALEARLRPRTAYAAVIDTALRDVFGQRLVGNPALAVRTTGFTPMVNYAYGRLLVERVGFRTLAVQHVNIDTLVVTMVPIPLSAEPRMLARLAWGNDSIWNILARGVAPQRIPVRDGVDRPMITGVHLPAFNAMSAGAPTLLALRVGGRTGRAATRDGPTALVQMTDLGVHARVGTSDAAVWVTGVSDGVVKPGADVELHDAEGRLLATARTDAEGIARMGNWTVPPEDTTGRARRGYRGDFEGYVSVRLGTDRAITPVSRYDPDLSPWRFNVPAGYGDERYAVAGAVFTERGIYRPGERVFAKAIVRTGPLGALRTPAAGDSVRWRFHARDEGLLREVTTPLSAFGTADQGVTLPANAPVGEYDLDIEVRRQGAWREVGEASYRVAEYRPPEFLVDMPDDKSTHFVGDRLSAHLSARYLFGAPMGRAVVAWSARAVAVTPWDLVIPGADGWEVGQGGNWWDGDSDEPADEFASRTDTLDARGERAWSVKAPPATKGRPMRVTLEATVTDVNRQAVSAHVTTIVHPADFYLAARPSGSDYFWTSGTPQVVQLLALRPDGQHVPGVRVSGTVARREWHRVRRERDGVSELVGEWVTDTVARCAVVTALAPASCAFTPTAGGMYTVSLSASDARGRPATTSFGRWASGQGWVPWNDESQFKMDVIPDRKRYAVGDTATVMFASPFTNADAWVTVEREGLLQQRRLHITAGATTIRLPITEAFAPNVFVSILVSRGRSAPPGALDDAGRPTIRVGYAELRVTPEVKRLAVTASTAQAVYRPGDTARVQVHVQDRARRGARSEVTLWAVDEGVLSLTGYRTPDPVSLIYRARGLGLRLASNMTSVAPQIPEGEKGRREAGGGGGADGAEILRSRFQTTAFFLGSVVTDASGNAVATAKLPDNITTFRIMAVAVTAGDRYGSGQSAMLVTRPLLARQALPRFVRPGDEFTAGAVVNRRDGAAAEVTVNASVTGASLQGDAEQHVTLAAMRGSEVRFPFAARPGDSASFRFDVRDDRNADAVRVAIPVRPAFHPVAYTVAGMLRDTATVDVALPAGIDADRSRLSVHVGLSPLAAIKGISQSLQVYPYQCSEQVISAALPLVALYRAERAGARGPLAGDPRASLTTAVQVLSSRQRGDGGIGYWSSTDWTTPWLSAYAGMVLLDARDQGIPVDTLVLSRLAGYLTASVRGKSAATGFTPVNYWYEGREGHLNDDVAAVDLMSRFGRPLVEAENELLRTAAQLSVEDRARLAEVLARRGQMVPARALMQSVWSYVRVVGRRAELTDTLQRRRFYFDSRVRPLARVLTATLAIAPDHQLVGPLAEGVTAQNNGGRDWTWNTQDYASAVTALAALDRRQRAQGSRSLSLEAGGRQVLQWTAGAPSLDSTVALRAVTGGTPGRVARLALRAGPGDGAVFYYVTLTEVPLAPPVTVLDNGIQVERWYEHPTTGAPVSTVGEGELVRVRLRVTVPATRFFVVLDDALPAGLEAVDLSLRTAAAAPGPGKHERDVDESDGDEAGDDGDDGWFGRWDSGWWSPFDHQEIRDDRVVYSASMLWKGFYTVSYLARATTPGTFIRPPAHAEEMYDPAVNGRSDGGSFIVTRKGQP